MDPQSQPGQLNGDGIDVHAVYAATGDQPANERRLLDFNPTISVPEGVQRFWEWYQAYELERG